MNKKSKAGGHRIGAGRPKGTGKYGERTYPLRVPASLLFEIQQIITQKTSSTKPVVPPKPIFNNVYPYSKIPSPSHENMPLYATRVAAGTPFPVDDYVDQYLDLNQHLVKQPAATFFVRVEGESMMNANIHENDILVVDRSIEPTNGRIIIAVVNGNLTVKRLEITQMGVRLMPENPHYQPIAITEEIDFRIWGVVTYVIHSVSR